MTPPPAASGLRKSALLPLSALVRADLDKALRAAVTATACGGGSKKKDVAERPPTASAAPHGAAGPADENKVVYHDAVAGNDVTVKMLRKIVAQMPKSMTCEELLAGGKALGNTYPNGEDLYLRICNGVPRK